MKTILRYIPNLIAGFVLLMSLPFKFGGAAESVALFTELGVEPYGRYIVGVMELVAGLLVLLPAKEKVGALFGGFILAGAIITHMTTLGFAGDKLQLAIMAVVGFAACSKIIYRKPVVAQTTD